MNEERFKISTVMARIKIETEENKKIKDEYAKKKQTV